MSEELAKGLQRLGHLDIPGGGQVVVETATPISGT